MDLEGVWEYRENVVYPELFGSAFRGIFPLTHDIFEMFPNAQVDPRWLFHGVFEFAPTDNRNSWLYVTSGYSNPWELEPNGYDPETLSGSGVEFVFQSSLQGDWAITFLLKMRLKRVFSYFRALPGNFLTMMSDQDFLLFFPLSCMMRR